jgi:hypothetical protein
LEKIGAKYNGPPLRVVEIHSAEEEFVLVTSRQDLPAELIGLIYRYRWQIELFFKWLKSILGSAHWLAESPRGVASQALRRLDRLAVARVGDRQASRQATNGGHGPLLHRLCHRSGTAPGTQSSKKLNQTERRIWPSNPPGQAMYFLVVRLTPSAATNWLLAPVT